MVLLKQTTVIDIVPITLNDGLSSKGLAEELPAPVHSLFLRACVQRTQQNCVRSSAVNDSRALLVGPPALIQNCLIQT